MSLATRSRRFMDKLLHCECCTSKDGRIADLTHRLQLAEKQRDNLRVMLDERIHADVLRAKRACRCEIDQRLIETQEMPIGPAHSIGDVHVDV